MDDSALQPILAGIARHALTTAGGALVTGGYMHSSDTSAFVGGGMVVAGIVWSWWQKEGQAQTAVLLKKMTASKSHAEAVEKATVLPAPDAKTITAAVAKAATGIATVLLVAFALSALVAAPAMAQAKLTGNIVNDIRAANAKPAASGVNVSSFQQALGTFNDGIQKITKEVVDTAIADVQAALDDATKTHDEISTPCWQAHLNLLKNLPVEWDAPPKMPIGIALGIQIQRDILNTINGTAKGTLKVDCAALYGDELKSLTGVGALLGVRIASGGLL